MIREIVKSPGAKAHMEGDYGYLRPSQFDSGAAASAATALRDLEAHNPAMKGLVLDLRNNLGGLLSEAVSLAGLFLDGGEIVSERGRDPHDVQRFNASPHGDLLAGRPVVVLINAGAASGAEIVAGALQDRGRALVVGMTSFGVGTIQTVIPLHGGADGALKLTTARFYTPNGRAIQGVGIQPDLKVAATIAEAATPPRQRYSEASLANTLTPETDKTPTLNSAPAEAPPSAAFNGDFQLKRALDLIKSRPAPNRS
jgi:carboxyl-terminal processing protease